MFLASLPSLYTFQCFLRYDLYKMSRGFSCTQPFNMFYLFSKQSNIKFLKHCRFLYTSCFHLVPETLINLLLPINPILQIMKTKFKKKKKTKFKEIKQLCNRKRQTINLNIKLDDYKLISAYNMQPHTPHFRDSVSYHALHKPQRFTGRTETALSESFEGLSKSLVIQLF